MAQEHVFLNDIISDHRERMINIKKYYPFFKLCDTKCKYEELDMGYITMAILRFFIEENNFKEKDITYPEYVEFMTNCIKRDFGLELSEEENKEVVDYIFDKIKNEGKPFVFEYFDPVDRKKRISRMKLIDSKIRDNIVWYSITCDAVEFYLDTKEIKDESKISVQQLLLEKLIRSKNFKGGTEVVERINSEVSRLIYRKNEVLNILSNDVFAGIEAYDRFVDTGMRWFEDEQKLFVKNTELIESALAKVSGEDKARTIDEIYNLEVQLKVAMNKHTQLLRACTELSVMADDIIRKAKLRRIRSGFDFRGVLDRLIKNEDTASLESLVLPLLKLNIRKQFNLTTIDNMLTYRPEKAETAEKIVETEAREIVFEDEVEDERIKNNYTFFMRELLTQIKEKGILTLKEFNETITQRYGEKVLMNGDYYSFFIHLCQKKEYYIGAKKDTNETFLEDIIPEYEEFEGLSFTLKLADGKEDTLTVCGLFEMSNITFERRY